MALTKCRVSFDCVELPNPAENFSIGYQKSHYLQQVDSFHIAICNQRPIEFEHCGALPVTTNETHQVPLDGWVIALMKVEMDAVPTIPDPIFIFQ